MREPLQMYLCWSMHIVCSSTNVKMHCKHTIGFGKMENFVDPSGRWRYWTGSYIAPIVKPCATYWGKKSCLYTRFISSRFWLVGLSINLCEPYRALIAYKTKKFRMHRIVKMWCRKYLKYNQTLFYITLCTIEK